MAELRHSAVAELLPWSLMPDGVNPAVALSEIRFMRQLGLRRRAPTAAYLAGLPLPLIPNRVAAMGRVRTLWLGPDEWLITAPDGAGPELPARLARALAGQYAAVADLSSSRTVVAITGARARDLLAKGCGLDLHPRSFAPGQCAQTLFAGVPVILDQVSAAPAYRLFVRRSTARWLCTWIIDTAEEFRFAR
jgi:sarcosine oxidase subunit gamma